MALDPPVEAAKGEVVMFKVVFKPKEVGRYAALLKLM